jgi:hypothetical protein
MGIRFWGALVSDCAGPFPAITVASGRARSNGAPLIGTCV